MSSTTIENNQTARYTIKIGGTEFSQADAQGLEHVSIEEHVDKIGVAQFTIGDNSEGWGSFKVGDEVEANVGGDQYKFKGVITSMRHGFQKGRGTVTVIAHDPLAKLASSRHVRTYGEHGSPVKDDEIFNQVLGEAGLEAGTVDAVSGESEYVFQRNESDLSFLRRLAARNGYLLRANEGKIDFVKTQFSGSAIEIPKGKVIHLDYGYADNQIPPELTVIGWDYKTKAKVEGTASSGDVTTIGGGTNSVSQTGQIYQQPAFISDVLVTSQGGAKAMAQAEMNRLARNFLRGKAVIQGNGEVRAGGLIKFAGHRDGFNPEVYVVSSKHVIETTGGFTTEINFCGNTYPQ